MSLAGWQVTPCDPIWYASPPPVAVWRLSELLSVLLYLYFLYSPLFVPDPSRGCSSTNRYTITSSVTAATDTAVCVMGGGDRDRDGPSVALTIEPSGLVNPSNQAAPANKRTDQHKQLAAEYIIRQLLSIMLRFGHGVVIWLRVDARRPAHAAI